MKKFNFHISDKTRQVIITVIVTIAGIALFSESYEAITTRNNAERLTAPSAPTTGNNSSKKVVEAHWQGMEVVPLTWELAAKLGLPINEKGVLVDEVTMAAADSGLIAKDVVQSVNGVPVTDLNEFYQITKRLRNQKQAAIGVKRNNDMITIDLISPDELGFAQLESAPMVLPGAIAPHRYRGPCTDCHAIGNTGQLTPDPAAVTLAPPPISKKTKNPHRNRGECSKCHIVR